MKWENMTCPECGETPVGTIEVLYGVASFNAQNEDGSFDYYGETDIWWDNQKTLQVEGLDVLTCNNHHEWHTKRIE